MTPRAARAVAALRRICAEELADPPELTIIDILEHPQTAEDEKIVATPTLIRALPAPMRRVIGDLSDRDRVLLGLNAGAVTLEGAGTIHDIMKRTLAGEDLKRTNEALQAIAAGSAYGMLIVDQQGTVHFANRAAQNLLRRAADELTGFPFGLPVVSSAVTEVDLILADGTPGVAELQVAESVWDGKDAYLVSLHNITDRVRKEQALEKAMMAAKAASRAKSDFLAQMSHELRTPLSVIIGFSEGLLDRTDCHPLNEHQKERVGTILMSGRHLLVLLNEVLDIARIEAGQVEIDLTTFDASHLVKPITVMAEALLRDNRAVAFRADVPDDLPPLTSDRDKVIQILTNLIGNAIKFTEHGSVMLRIRRSGERMEFSIEDTGPGIPEDERDRVFDRFVQLRRAGRAVPPGTGLGLPIARSLAELLGGTLTLARAGDHGCTFTLSLPLTRGEEQSREGEPQPALASTPGPATETGNGHDTAG
jgi:signal transduction histidine kinase